MAKQHFLNGNFTGSLGAITGVQVKGKSVVKLKKYSIERNTFASHMAFHQFAALRRVAAAIAPATSSTIGKGVKRIRQQENIEKLWKSWMAGGQLSADRYEGTTPQTVRYSLNNVSYNPQNYTLTFETKNISGVATGTQNTFLFFLLNPQGNVAAVHFFPLEENQVVIQTNGQYYGNLYLASVVIQGKNDKWQFVSAKGTKFQN